MLDENVRYLAQPLPIELVHCSSDKQLTDNSSWLGSSAHVQEVGK